MQSSPAANERFSFFTIILTKIFLKVNSVLMLFIFDMFYMLLIFCRKGAFLPHKKAGSEEPAKTCPV